MTIEVTKKEQEDNEIYIKQIIDAFGEISDASKVAEAKKKIRKIHEGRHRLKLPRNFVLKYMQIAKETADTKYKTAILQCFNILFWEMIDDFFDECVDIVLTMIVHENGSVREGARRLGTYLRMRHVFNRGDTTAYLAYLHMLANIIKNYRKGNSEKYIENLKPSVYKSAVLLWHESLFKTIGELWLSDKEIREIGAPVYSYMDDEWQDENEININTITNELWENKKAGYSHATPERFEALYTFARNRFYSTLSKRGYTKAEIDSFEQGLDLYGTEYSEVIVMAMTKKFLKENEMGDMDELNTSVHSLQSLTNHRFFPNYYGKPISIFLAHVQAVKEENYKHTPENLDEFLKLVLETHIAVDVLHEKFILATQKGHAEFLKWVRQIEKEIPDKDFAEEKQKEKNYLASLESATSVVHHALDWLFQLEPWIAYRKNPKELAAIGWYVVKEYNMRRAWKHLSYVENDVLCSFGGWAKNGIRGASQSAFYTITRGMRDEQMLKIYPTDNLDGVGKWLVELRQEVESRAKRLLIKLDMRMSIIDWLELIYDSSGTSTSTEILELFTSDENFESDNKEDLKTITDMWNIFPHKSLGDLSPVEMIEKYKNKK